MENVDNTLNMDPVERNSPEKHTISGQKLIIVNYYKSLRAQAEGISYPDMLQHISKVLGIDLSCVSETISEYKQTNTVPSSSPMRNRSENHDQIGSIDKHVVRKMVRSFWSNREIPTIDKLLSAINGDRSLPKTKKRSLKIVLNSLNFKCSKQEIDCVITEKGGQVCWRRKYLKAIRTFREEGRSVYYLGDTWFDTNEVCVDQKPPCKIELSESLSSGSTSQANRGKRFIILHIGSADGFVPGGLWCIEANKSLSNNYRNRIESRRFYEWLEGILPLLKDNAVIVLGHECYQSEKSEQIPTIEWQKKEISDWLLSKGEQIDSKNLIKLQLMNIVKRIKSKFDTYVIDEMAKRNGKTVLRLPPFHSEFNAIELVWPLMKQHVVTSTSNITLDFERLRQSIESFKIEHWQSSVTRTIETEQESWDADYIIDDLLEQNIPSDCSSGDSLDSSDYDEDKLFKL